MTAAQPLLSQERERFVDDLLGYMTLAEKLGQLDLARSPEEPGLEAAIAAGQVGGLACGDPSGRLQVVATEQSRLGIPLLTSAQMEQAISPWALAASWDENLARQLGAAAAETARRSGANCLSGNCVVLGENQNCAHALIATSEAHLAARLVAAFAKGAGKGAGLVDAGAGNPVLAIPAVKGVADKPLRCGLDLVQDEGVLALDCPAVDREIALKAGFAGLLVAECRRLIALLADHFATTSARSSVEAAEKAIAERLVSAHEIDGAVRGVLAVKHALGLFRRRQGALGGLAANDAWPSGPEIVRRSMVLLRNESGLLPLSPVSDRVLVVGAVDGGGAACAEALSRAGIGYSMAPGLALRRGAETWADPVAADHFAVSLTRDAAQRADFVLVTLDMCHFSPPQEGSWSQPGRAMLALLQALSSAGPRLVAIVNADEPVDLGAADQYFSAVLHCWGPTSGLEEALADVLSGRTSPQGRLPVTAGRFLFGQGLGYGESVFSSLSLSAGPDHLVARIRVRNSGSFTARETVQTYVRGSDGELRLVDFAHVTLAPGEDAPVQFELGLKALGELGAAGRLELSPGEREIAVGKSTGRLLTARFDVTATLARAMRRQDGQGLHLAAG